MMVRREQSQEILQKVKQEVVRSEMGGAEEMEELMFSRGLTWVAGWVVAGRSMWVPLGCIALEVWAGEGGAGQRGEGHASPEYE